MPLPVSRTQLDKLGDRLAADSASAADMELLEQVLAAYDEVISRALEIIEPLGYRPTSRLKTSGTLIEKLQREHGMKLKGVQDIAGLRIVLSRDQDQDEVVAQLVGELERATEAPVRVVDRRAAPSHGYRAVHLIAKIDNLPVEIQVRTFLQDQWAQAFEALADRWGRGIRYGDTPDKSGSKDLDRTMLVDLLRSGISSVFATAEPLLKVLPAARPDLDDGADMLEEACLDLLMQIAKRADKIDRGDL